MNSLTNLTKLETLVTAILLRDHEGQAITYVVGDEELSHDEFRYYLYSTFESSDDITFAIDGKRVVVHDHADSPNWHNGEVIAEFEFIEA